MGNLVDEIYYEIESIRNTGMYSDTGVSKTAAFAISKIFNKRLSDFAKDLMKSKNCSQCLHFQKVENDNNFQGTVCTNEELGGMQMIDMPDGFWCSKFTKKD